MPQDNRLLQQQFEGYTLEEIAKAVAMVESSGGTNVGPRFEPGFLRRYLSKQLEPDFEKLRAQYGNEAMASSYGPWQVLYRTAYENGFRGSPQQLADPTINRQLFEKKFTNDFNRTGRLRDALLRYNGGGNPQYPDKVIQYLPKNNMQTAQMTPEQVAVNKPRIQNQNGSFSTERTITIGVDGGFINIPTIVNGRQLSHQEAIRNVDRSKISQYPRYRTIAEAVKAAKERSDQIGSAANKLKGGD